MSAADSLNGSSRPQTGFLPSSLWCGIPDTGRQEREVLARAARVVRTVAEQAAKADAIANRARADDLDGSHPVAAHAKWLRQELLQVKTDLERELERFVLDCTACSRQVHWVAGAGVSPGHWVHCKPAPHGEPVV